MTDTGNYPFLQAAHFTKGRTQGNPIWIVIHDMESAETSHTAEDVARMFHDPNSRVASAHLCIDNNSIVRCVHDADTAYGAAHANNRGLHIEHAGVARQTLEQWLDPFGKAMLNISSQAASLWVRKYHIPIRHLTVNELKAGHSGFVGHRDVEVAWPSTGHSDPGPNFPWDYYLAGVARHVREG